MRTAEEKLQFIFDHCCCHYESFGIACNDTLDDAIQMHEEENEDEIDGSAMAKDRRLNEDQAVGSI